MRKAWPLVIASLLLLLHATVAIVNPAFIQELRYRSFDWFQILHPRAYEPLPVVIVDIDDASLAKTGQWPWSRHTLATLIQHLKQQNAAVIAWDIVFAEPDEDSPARYLPTHLPEVANTLPTLADYDAEFAAAMKDHGQNITGFVLSVSHDANTTEDIAQPALKTGFSYLGDATQALSFLHPFNRVVKTLPTLEAAANGNGALNNVPDRDGIIRRIPLLYQSSGQMVPSLFVEALRVAQGAKNILVKTAPETGAITDIRVGDATIPTTASGELWLYYTPYQPTRYIPAWQVLAGMANPALENAIVLVGTSAAGLKDIRATPLNPAIAGVEVHAQALEQVLSGIYLQRPDWLQIAEVFAVIIVGITTIFFTRYASLRLASFGALLLIGLGIGTPIIIFQQAQLLVDPILPTLTALVLSAHGLMARYFSSEREKRYIKQAFGQYMSPQMVDMLAKDPSRLTLGGEMRELTIMFSDIRGFTSISEQFDAVSLTTFINQFLTPMTGIILNHQGTIDKYIGDCIMAFWNAPLDDAHHAEHACRAALSMQQALAIFNQQQQQRTTDTGGVYHPISIGIGINTGKVCVGNMGSDQRFDYSVLGDDVNLASRLEGQSKNYDAVVILSGATAGQVPQLATLLIDRIRVKGKHQAVEIYTLLGDETTSQQTDFFTLKTQFHAMLTAYQHQQWDTAEAMLHTLETSTNKTLLSSIEGTLRLYSARIAHFRSHPPSEQWDGIFTATEK